jgi:hypothetical protein
MIRHTDRPWTLAALVQGAAQAQMWARMRLGAGSRQCPEIGVAVCGPVMLADSVADPAQSLGAPGRAQAGGDYPECGLSGLWARTGSLFVPAAVSPWS